MKFKYNKNWALLAINTTGSSLDFKIMNMHAYRSMNWTSYSGLLNSID